MFGALAGAITWNVITWVLGIPSSSSHALIGGLVGAGVAKAGPGAIIWGGLNTVIAAIVLSPLTGFLLALLFVLITSWLSVRSRPFAVDHRFRLLQFISSALLSLGHGGNDAQKTMGIITVLLFSQGVLQGDFHVPLWVVLYCQAVMALGTFCGGWRIVHTMGSRITPEADPGLLRRDRRRARAIRRDLARRAGIHDAHRHRLDHRRRCGAPHLRRPLGRRARHRRGVGHHAPRIGRGGGALLLGGLGVRTVTAPAASASRAGPPPPDRRLAAIRRLAMHVAETVEAGFALRLWNGETVPLGPHARSDLAVAIRSPSAVTRLLRRPRLGTLIGLLAEGQIEIEGGTLLDLAAHRGAARRGMARALQKRVLAGTMLPFLFDAGGRLRRPPTPTRRGMNAPASATTRRWYNSITICRTPSMPYSLIRKCNIPAPTSRKKTRGSSRRSWPSSLPAGLAFPFDFGFLPGTLAADGDPLDILVLMDAPAYPGCVVGVRLLGAIEAEQRVGDGPAYRNDRLIGLAEGSTQRGDPQRLADLDDHLLDEIEAFFATYDGLRGKAFWPIRRVGPDAARGLLDRARTNGAGKGRRSR